VTALFNEMLRYLTSPAVKNNFKLVLLKALRHLVAQLNFRDPALLEFNPELNLIWQDAVRSVYDYADKILS